MLFVVQNLQQFGQGLGRLALHFPDKCLAQAVRLVVRLAVRLPYETSSDRVSRVLPQVSTLQSITANREVQKSRENATPAATGG